LTVSWAALAATAFAGPSFGNALASASIEITSFVWYVDDGDGVPDAGDQPITAAIVSGAGNITFQLGAQDSAGANAQLEGAAPDSALGNRSFANLGADLDLGFPCASPTSADCAAAPQDFDPIATGFPSEAYSNTGQELSGFYARTTATSDPIEAGLRADVSLPGTDTTVPEQGIANAQWISSGQFRSNVGQPANPFNTYFAISYVVQALANLSGDAFNSSAQATTIFNLSVTPLTNPLNDRLSWLPTELNLTSDGSNPTVGGSGTVYSFNSADPNSFLTLTSGELYSVFLIAQATASATANEPPAVVPAPSVLALFGAGLFALGMVRRRPRADRRSETHHRP
jgi:hypothetical protein